MKKDYIFTFPNIGLMRITAKYLLESMGLRVIPPVPVTQKTINIGIELCDEAYCMPFKINVGDMVRSIESGANAVIIAEADGMCRFGGLWVAQKKILEKYFGRQIEFFPVNQGSPLAAFGSVIKATGIKISGEEITDIIDRVVYKTELCEYAISSSSYSRPREILRGSSSRAFISALQMIDAAKTWDNLKSVQFSEVEIDKNVNPVRIMLVGSIFDIVYPSSKFQLVEMLGNLGAQVESTLGFHDIILLKSKKEKEFNAAKKYVGTIAQYCGFGGFALNTIENAALAKKNGFDGIVHLYPFGCMPEIVSKTFLSSIRKETDIPIISLLTDEHTAGAGFMTRVEAFIDMIKQRKEGIL